MTTLPPEELHTLLTNAAKACGINECHGNYLVPDGLHTRSWQPHLPGLDSQVLAAELGIDTDWRGNYVNCSWDGNSAAEEYINHPSKAHAQAMAVLRVAAQIGKNSNG